MTSAARTILLLSAMPVAWPAGAQDLTVHGALDGRAISAESRVPWIDGGFGRISEGRRPNGFEAFWRGEAQLGIDWRPSDVLLLRLHGTARTEPDAAGGSRAGLTEAFLQYRPELRPDLALRFRAGLMFPPTSRENVDPLWQSPYTLTLSAINTWIGEELHPVGLDVTAQFGEPGGSELELAGMVFGASDAAGSLLSWRGWAMGTRLSVVGESLPLPPLPSLAPGGFFADQRPDGTVPIDELDGRLGWQVRGRWAREGTGLVQAAWTDTRGDRGLHRGQYSWATHFASLGAELQLGRVRLVAEGLAGDTGMGGRSGPHVDIRMHAGYALATWATSGDELRLTARYDRFHNEDTDGTAEPNDESGWAVTVAAFFAPRPWLRLGVEYLELRADRPAAAFAGTPLGSDARRTQAELRLRF